MPKTSFAWSGVQQARDLGLDDLLALQWAELEQHQDVLPLDVDWRAYESLERQGQLKMGLLTLAGALVGYNLFFVHRPLHHRSTLWAINDAVYLLPEHRRGTTGIFLLAEAERLLRSMGAKVILYGAKPDLSADGSHATVSRLLQRMGYGAFEHTWSKTL